MLERGRPFRSCLNGTLPDPFTVTEGKEGALPIGSKRPISVSHWRSGMGIARMHKSQTVHNRFSDRAPIA